MILAGDLGGTKTILALYDEIPAAQPADISDYSGNHTVLVQKKIETYHSHDFHSIDSILKTFLQDTPVEIDKAAIGVAGPVLHGKSSITNLPWVIDEKEIGSSLKIPKVKIVNDLVAMASSVPFLSAEQVTCIYPAREKDSSGRIAVVAPGTGLGHGLLVHTAEGYSVVPSEAGHNDFAPIDDRQISLLQYLRKEYDHVYYELILSGRGLVNIYNFLVETGFAVPGKDVLEAMKMDDPAAVISRFAMQHKDAVCTEALDIFASVLGAQSGNYVLTTMATDGVYLGGGIPAKILDKITDGTFLKSYLAKGVMTNLVSSTPVFVILEKNAGLIGAAHIAKKLF